MTEIAHSVLTDTAAVGHRARRNAQNEISRPHCDSSISDRALSIVFICENASSNLRHGKACFLRGGRPNV
jgi:hypothetical protein